MNRRNAIASIVWVICLPLAGCSSHPAVKDIPTVPVQGTVTLDGEPVNFGEGYVTFVPERVNTDKVIRVTGSIDSKGRYELFTHAGTIDSGYSSLFAMKRGAPTGTYAVTVTVREKLDRAQHDLSQPGARPQNSLLSERYARADTSGLRVRVVNDPADGAYDLRLSR